jgi:hypothetical protein
VIQIALGATDPTGCIPPHFVLFFHMTRSQAIALITSKLASLDDERVQEIADLVQSMDGEDLEECVLPRELTPRELALIEQSKEDFRASRTLTLEEAEARTDEFLSARRRERMAK